MKRFIKFWDNFVEGWFNALPGLNPQNAKNQARSIINCVPSSDPFLSSGRLDPNELPEPYLGDPCNSKFIIINLNPGASSGNSSNPPSNDKDNSKYFSNYRRYHNLQPKLQIDEFADKYQKKYSAFLKDWSCLLPRNKNTVCGGAWWQGKDPNVLGGRMRWIKSFADKLGMQNLHPDEVFALEVCPFHSMKWNNDIILDSNTNTVKCCILKAHLKKNVFIPAAYAAKINDIKCIVCVGNIFNNIIKDIFNIQTPTRSWNKNDANWPTNRKGNGIDRTYTLYSININNCGLTNFLVISSRGSNKLPSGVFGNIEKEIVKYIKQ